eukprot:4572047-Amphidinium_carterae.1
MKPPKERSLHWFVKARVVHLHEWWRFCNVLAYMFLTSCCETFELPSMLLFIRVSSWLLLPPSVALFHATSGQTEFLKQRPEMLKIRNRTIYHKRRGCVVADRLAFPGVTFACSLPKREAHHSQLAELLASYPSLRLPKKTLLQRKRSQRTPRGLVRGILCNPSLRAFLPCRGNAVPDISDTVDHRKLQSIAYR